MPGSVLSLVRVLKMTLWHGAKLTLFCLCLLLGLKDLQSEGNDLFEGVEILQLRESGSSAKSEITVVCGAIHFLINGTSVAASLEL